MMDAIKRAIVEQSLRSDKLLSLPAHINSLNILTRWGSLSGTTAPTLDTSMGPAWLAVHRTELYQKLSPIY